MYEADCIFSTVKLTLCSRGAKADSRVEGCCAYMMEA